MSAGPELAEAAYAKINLTLRIVGRRPDGYHALESLVCFARVGDQLTLRPGAALG
ncbi:MAG: 4-(cytidine 5'-diphospho)-2-C-methyl-D-erythritol kinase, partial [Xanthobacteraceae bacterium]